MTPTPTTVFVIMALAVWRATIMITVDEGPFGVFAWLRDHIDPYQRTWLGRGIRCEWCVSWWIGLAGASWLWYFGLISAVELFYWWFGLSGGAIVVQQGTTAMTSLLSRRR